MPPKHVSILKANQGELEALRNLMTQTADRFTPLFEIGRITDAIRATKYMQNSRTPITTHLERKLGPIVEVWRTRDAMVDAYQWDPDARVETGEHLIPFIVRYLRSLGVAAIPVVGYDRWSDEAYRLGLQSIPTHVDKRFCLRLDSGALLEDVTDPEHFVGTVADIVDGLQLDPSRCSVIMDYADVSANVMSIERLIGSATDVVRQLQSFGFAYYVVAGCSMPKTIDLAVEDRDSTGMIMRKEMLVWQALKSSMPDLLVISGDYGVRGPTTSEAPSKHTNGKIRYTVPKQLFIARGHSIHSDGDARQMRELSATVIRSPHYLGPNFSWGDRRILSVNGGAGPGSTTTWIAIDTNHHLTFVVQEVEEFERRVVVDADGQ